MRVLVWDLPTRLFHWLLAAAFAAAWLSSESDPWLDLHVLAGYLLAGLILLRLIWGVTGSRYARFRGFAFSPRAALGYLQDARRREAKRYLGHNPAGSWAIYLLLALGLLIAASGLLTLGGEEQHGPLAGKLGFAAGEASRQVHAVLAWLMLGLVALHLVGVMVESWLHRENLARAMVSGYKQGQRDDAIPARHAGMALLMLVVLGVFSAWYLRGYAMATPERPYQPFATRAMPDNATWRSECGSCHLAYAPGLLPARSWARMLREQDRHFGESLGLDAASVAEIRAYLLRHAADAQATEAAYKIDRSIPAGSAPLRITETGYWKRKHGGIADNVWRGRAVGARANCGACHLDAEQGGFEDGAMRFPSGASE